MTGPGGQTAQDDGLISVRTLRRVSGTAGAELTVGQECPANALVNWGDGSTSSATCSTGSMTARHTYAAGGRYRVKFAYEDGSRGEVVAAVAPTARPARAVGARHRPRAGHRERDRLPGRVQRRAAARTPRRPSPPPHTPARSSSAGPTPAPARACASWSMEESRNVAANFSGTVEPPSVNELAVATRTDTTAQLRFVVSAGGAPATYTVVVDGTPLAPVSIGSGTDPQELTHALAGLQPGRRYAVADRREQLGGHGRPRGGVQHGVARDRRGGRGDGTRVHGRWPTRARTRRRSTGATAPRAPAPSAAPTPSAAGNTRSTRPTPTRGPLASGSSWRTTRGLKTPPTP